MPLLQSSESIVTLYLGFRSRCELHPRLKNVIAFAIESQNVPLGSLPAHAAYLAFSTKLRIDIPPVRLDTSLNPLLLSQDAAT